MFAIEKTLQFINVDLAYLKRLHEVCPEVYYKPVGYENKPFLGVLINGNGRKYVLPLSSAKEKRASFTTGKCVQGKLCRFAATLNCWKRLATNITHKNTEFILKICRY